MFMFSFALFSEFLYLYCFFHLGLFYWSASQISWLPWSGPVNKYRQIPDWEWGTGLSFYNPLKFPETESKHLWLLCHFLFYSRFCISALTPVTLAAIYFLKRGKGCYFHLFYFILSLFSILIFIHLRHLKKS